MTVAVSIAMLSTLLMMVVDKAAVIENSFCGFLLTILSYVIIALTMPFSLCLCLKVTNCVPYVAITTASDSRSFLYRYSTWTRMVQLPATAAIEHVAAWHFFPGSPGVRGVFCPGALLAGGTFGRGDFWPGALLSGGLCPFPKFNAYTNRLGFLCLAS